MSPAGRIEREVSRRRPDRASTISRLVLGATLVAIIAMASRPEKMRVCRKSPVSIQLNRIAKQAKDHFARTGAFPRGQSQLLPPWPCCPERCKALPAQAWSTDPVWAALGFSLEEPHQFRYRYESSDGASFRVVAIADLDCDGISVVHALDGSSDRGHAQVRITEPGNVD